MMKCKRLFVLVCLLLGVTAGTHAAHWTVNPHAWQYDMTAYVKLEVNGIAVTDYSDYEIAAFCGDECRGVMKPQTASDGTAYGYLRIRSNVASGETITLRVYQVSADKETLLGETIAFEAQTMIGTPGEPMVLALGSFLMGDVNGDGVVNEVDAQQILDVSVGLLKVSDLNVPAAIDVPGGNSNAYEVNAQIVLDYSVASVKPW